MAEAPPDFKRGDHVEVQDAFGKWHRAVAITGIEGTHREGRKIHDFPVVMVVTAACLELLPGGEHRVTAIGWPIEHVRMAPPPVEDDLEELRRVLGLPASDSRVSEP